VPQMNFYDAQLTLEGGKYYVTVENAKVLLSDDKQAKLSAKKVEPQAVTLGVRPEHIQLLQDDSGIHGTVSVSEMMGSAVHLHVNANGKDTIIIVQTMDLKGHYGIGSTVDFTFGGNVAHVFSKTDENNLEF